jgi:hypothetical protein
MRRIVLLSMFMVFAVVAIGVAGIACVAEAQEPADDRILLELMVEDWVETETANAVIAVDIAVESGTFGQARAEVERILKSVSSTAPWRLTQFQRLNHDAGYERWRILAEARLPGAELADLDRKTKQASKPGATFRIAGIDYTPTLAERQALEADLRARIYVRVQEEIAAAELAFPGRGFRLESIQFPTDGSIGPVPRMAMAESMPRQKLMADASGGGGGTAVAEKMVLTARVVLAAPVPE